jgi:hypothetical protein
MSLKAAARIMPILKDHPAGLNTRQLADMLGLSIDSVRYALQINAQIGQAVFVGDRKLGRWCAMEHQDACTRAYWAQFNAAVGSRAQKRIVDQRRRRLEREARDVEDLPEDPALTVKHRTVPAGSVPRPVTCVWDLGR